MYLPSFLWCFSNAALTQRLLIRNPFEERLVSDAYTNLSRSPPLPSPGLVAGLMLVEQDEYRDSGGSVVAADFYHASELLPLTDEEIIERVHQTYLATCVPEFRCGRTTTGRVR